MRKYYSKCSKYLVSDYFNEGKEMYKTKIPNVFYKKEDDGIIYQYEYDKDDNVINKKEWSNISQDDFLNDKWSVVYYIDENTISSEYSDIFNSYDEYCEKNNIPKLEESIINQYFCYVITHEKNIIIKELDGLKQVIQKNQQNYYLVLILLQIHLFSKKYCMIYLIKTEILLINILWIILNLLSFYVIMLLINLNKNKISLYNKEN